MLPHLGRTYIREGTPPPSKLSSSFPSSESLRLRAEHPGGEFSSILRASDLEQDAFLRTNRFQGLGATASGGSTSSISSIFRRRRHNISGNVSVQLTTSSENLIINRKFESNPRSGGSIVTMVDHRDSASRNCSNATSYEDISGGCMDYVNFNVSFTPSISQVLLAPSSTAALPSTSSSSPSPASSVTNSGTTNASGNGTDDGINSFYFYELKKREYLKPVYDPEFISILNGDENACKRHIRVSYRSFRHLAAFFGTKRHGWSVRFETATFLFWLGCGSSYRVVSVATGIPVTTVHDIVKKCLKVLVDNTSHFIKLPSPEEFPEIGRGFAMRGRSTIFSHALGALDGTYFNVRCPVRLHEQYITRKLTYAIQLQAVCDANGKFINIFTGFPGSVHDQRVLQWSPLYLNGNFPPQNFLLADAGYTLSVDTIKILTPYKMGRLPLTWQQRKFNLHHSMARNIIERCFGMMKQRWRFQNSQLSLSKTTNVIAACCIMHNICVSENDVFEPSFEENFEDNQTSSEEASSNSNYFRDELCNILSNE